ncbi:MAG: efflux RND transporter periplasmic adaptor subunit [Candidatus Kapaibacterium sp.]
MTRSNAFPFISKTLLIIVLTASIASCSGSGDKNTIKASGTIEATEVNISSKAASQLKVLSVDEGSHVKIGDTIAIIDHVTLDLQLREADAALSAAVAQADLLKKGARAEDIQQAEESVTQSEANHKLAAQELLRIEALTREGAATKEQLDAAQSKYDVTSSQIEAAKQGVARLRKFTRPEDLRAALARVEQANAAKARVAQMINDCYIISPVDGIVTHKVVEAGELIGTGATIVTVTELDKVHLTIYVTESELPKVKLGGLANVVIDGMPGKSYIGKVIYISPEAEFTPKNIQTKDDRTKLVFGVKIEIPNPNDELKRGLPADASLGIATGK